ncbi:prepilin peptidase [Mycolicibacterium brumae]|uniref:Prepilin peptidase n=1 Tax=Mycolicibacterium brumae TaxID=85968 RepID=A0A2G5PCW2_9MYCO|nr:A24 family peptidase [Mycolicibacterium brumae]MCV7193592.1 prepilin peptidase [Mycolicibacterium brumae]PIB76162.1 prepilin peptidase [Mycolicibacterium brumae]RWA17291.1 hypothetical protein MBRU_06615 [Mycolicibacterium brumae DSM 44177]UWW09135.1 A24 family peptidase [Mycolicibacterium brumae]
MHPLATAGATVAAAVWLAALTVCDLRSQRLPNALTLPGAAIILAVATWAGVGQQAMAGALALAGPYLLLHLRDPRGLGAGDVKLAIGVGGLTGAFGAAVWLAAALSAPLLTAGWALTRPGRLAPHGPAMCLASAAAILLR